MKRLLLVVMAIICAIEMYAQTQMQMEFEKFLNRFPIREWTDLDSIRFLTPDDMNLCDSIPLNIAQKNMWYEGKFYSPKCDYNHISRTKVSISHPDWGDMEPPFIRTKENEYRNYHGSFFGRFTEQRGMKQDSITGEFVPSDEYSAVYPLARIEMHNDVVMLVVLYKFMPEDSYSTYSIDAYTYTKADQQMCSAICLFDTGFNLTHTKVVVDIIVNDEYALTSVEQYEFTTEEGDWYDVLVKEEYRVEPDGYITELMLVEPYKNMIKGVVVDPDGCVNVRKSPNVNSKVLYTIKSGSEVYCTLIDGTKWGHVVEYDNGRCVIRGTGFIHLSRINTTLSN